MRNSSAVWRWKFNQTQSEQRILENFLKTIERNLLPFFNRNAKGRLELIKIRSNRFAKLCHPKFCYTNLATKSHTFSVCNILNKPMRVELDRNKLSRNLQVSQSICKFLQFRSRPGFLEVPSYHFVSIRAFLKLSIKVTLSLHPLKTVKLVFVWTERKQCESKGKSNLLVVDVLNSELFYHSKILETRLAASHLSSSLLVFQLMPLVKLRWTALEGKLS